MRKTVFVVDDSATNLSIVEVALDEHYHVVTFSSALKMFPVLEKLTPDLILLDIEMPDMNGFEAMKRLKAHERHSKIPVIFLTALSDADGESPDTDLDAVDFITKPFSVTELLNRIKNQI